MKVFNPGSAEAIAHGCKCDPEKNYHGAGEPFNDGKNTRAYIHWTCAMHSEFYQPAEVTDDGNLLRPDL